MFRLWTGASPDEREKTSRGDVETRRWNSRAERAAKNGENRFVVNGREELRASASPRANHRGACAMKFTLAWLKDHLETEADAQAVGDKLTSIGLEVESIEDAGARLKDFAVAHVISAEKHPNADKLKLCMVDTGSGEPVQVVCGAPNAHTGMKAVFAKPGVVIPATGDVL